MRKMTVEVYTFEELSPKAQGRAIEEYRRQTADDPGGDYQMVTDTMVADLQALGLPSEDLRWRLAHTQGDGVAFYGPVDLDAYLTANKLQGKYAGLRDEDGDLVAVNIRKVGSHLDDHYNTMDVEVTPEADLTAAQDKLVEELEDHLSEQIKEVSGKLEHSGYEQLEYLNSDEVISDILIDNDYEFYESGEML